MASQTESRAYVLGVGMMAFLKPRATRMYTELAFEAGVEAMLDAHVTYDQVEAGVACYASGPTCSGQRTFYQFGMTGIPIYNVNNACATGYTGIHMVRNFVRSGTHVCVLVVGFEQMNSSPLATRGADNTPKNPQMFGNAGREYMERYGATADNFAEIVRISHEHSSRNPYAQFQTVYTLEQIQKAPMIYYPMTKLQCSPTSDGAAAAVIVSQRFLDARPEMKNHAILIAGQALQSDLMTRAATAAALAEAAASIEDIKVCELHDCFSANELISLDAMGFCPKGQAHHLIRSGNITYGGKGPICAELTWQLRGWARNGRLVKDVEVALQHNIGLGGAIAVSIYKRSDGKTNTASLATDSEIATLSGLGYNPVVEARYVTRAQAESVRSRKAPCNYALDNTLDLLEGRQGKL
ncbi:acetyl-CoA acetyltransferase [Aspergillus granulosus]|uniref:Acetyl-CoA acetyltransferase n=1 Tax=Aspergillus granulosus TaxID=176169 RepID=A0ABR4HT38_9EURO